MDTFFEQIITIKKGIKETLSFLGIWFLAIFLCLILLFVKIPVISSFSALLVLGILFGAYKLCAFLNIEYEYIITNGVMDIDKIINCPFYNRYADKTIALRYLQMLIKSRYFSLVIKMTPTLTL